MSNLGIIRLTYEGLAGLLNLPAGHSITAIFTQDVHDMGNQTISIVVSGPRLPDHCDGEPLQIVSLMRNGRGKTEFC